VVAQTLRGEGGSGIAPGGQGRNRPWGLWRLDSRSGLGVGMEGLGVIESASGVGALKASAPAPEDRGTASRRDRAAGERESRGPRSAAVPRGVGSEAVPNSNAAENREGFQITQIQNGLTASALRIWAEPLLVAGLRAGSPAGPHSEGFREGLCLLRVRGAAPGRVEGRRPPSMG